MTRTFWTWPGLVAIAMMSSADPVAEPAPPPPRHLILIVEGDANGLRVTHIASKDGLYTPPRRAATTWSVSVRRSDGAELGRFPVDLSKFDLNPDHVGRGLRVEGDVVWDTRVMTLVRIPRFEDAAELIFLRRGSAVSSLAEEDYTRMMEGELLR